MHSKPGTGILFVTRQTGRDVHTERRSSMLKNMEYVYAVYQNGSFSKAAEALYISQPALSTAIRKIEAELQLPLFDRSSSPIQLTPAGEYYIASIQKIMAIEQDMRQHFSEMVKKNQTIINVGSASYFCTYVLPQIVSAFKEEHADAVINLLEANSGEFAGLFQSDVLDLCLSVDSLPLVQKKHTLSSQVWQQEQILLAVPAEFPVVEPLREFSLTFDQVQKGMYMQPQVPAISLAAFKQTPFLFLKPGNDLHDRAFSMCRNGGFEPNVVMYLDQLLTSYYVACSGKGAAFLRAQLLQHVEPTSKLCFFKLDDAQAVRNIMLYYRQGSALSAITREFVDFLSSWKF